MPTTEEILKDELDALKRDLILEYDRKGMRASGRWAEGLEVTVRENTGKLEGLKYTEQLEYGRRATSSGGGQKGERTVQAQIEDWIEDKGIKAIESNMTTKTLAFLIARKIHREGYNRKQYGGVSLVSEIATPQRLKSMLDKVEEGVLFNIASELTIIIMNLERA